jgi:hypothetical protein
MTTNTAPRADLIGFTLTHKLFRNELPRLAGAFAGAARGAVVSAILEDHLRLVTDHLLRHHQEEDEFHWPVLGVRAPEAVPLLDRLEREHVHMDPLLAAARDRRRPVIYRAGVLSELTDLVTAHLDEEDRAIVPLLERHITGPEQFESMQRSRAKIPASDELRVLAMMLASATEDEARRMLAPLPDEVVDAWRTLAAPALDAVHQELAATAAAGTCTRSTGRL